jgi:hypothetical protein
MMMITMMMMMVIMMTMQLLTPFFLSSSPRRILSVDTNQQLLVSLSDSGFPITSLDINGQYSIIWPHQISCRLLHGTSTTTTTTTTAGRYGYDAVEVYISELLGRVWRMVLYRDLSTGSFNFK